ncbi:uncharacterized protein C10orf67 homolog, mitochondrial isoform X2 [Coturnix japonica]|uniref:uncharacterized protein C10orf67 homolog, mitochondrial isoform X2 n=1 Tax=Coturnix japonica TaxID=93934 RepID=UPI000777186E|nr:uncharacterized protein C10orf67 homolog, mitochondrial isoform X2 [Coturnix japonica]
MSTAGRGGPLPWARLLAPTTLELLALPCGLQGVERRHSISDDLNIGYHSRDHATQTDIKEIPELKELAIATQALIEKEVQLRQSYQQQLCDALAVLRAKTEKYYNINIEEIEGSQGKLLRYLRDKLQEKESIIGELKRKLWEYQVNKRTKMVVFEDDDRGNKKLEKENEEFKEEVFRLRSEIARLEDSLQHSEKEKRALDKQVQRMQLKMESDERTIQKLVEFQEQMKAELENGRSLGENLITSVAPEQQPDERSLNAENGELKKCEGQERQTIARKKAEQSNAIWKKKFQIVQNSLHAIKDEMFLRQTLQRQLLALRYTSPGETMVCPVCCIENDRKGTNRFKAGSQLPSTSDQD